MKPGLRGHPLAAALLAALLLLAAVLRLGGMRFMEWKMEERLSAETACSIAAGGALPLDGGPTSVGLRMPPGFPWMLGLLWPLRPSPVGAATMLAALNLGALAMAARWSWQWLGPRAAVLMLALAAAAPWPLLYARKVWTATPMPIAGAVLLLVIGRFARARGAPRMVLASLALLVVALAACIHPMAVMLAPPVVLALWLLAGDGSRPRLLLGMAPGALAVVAFVVAYSLWMRDVKLLPANRPGRPGVRRTVHVARHLLESQSSLGVLEMLGPDAGGVGPAYRAAAVAAGATHGALFAGGLLLALARSRRREAAAERMLAALVGGTLALFLAVGFVSQRQYALLFLMPSFALGGLAADALERRARGMGVAAVGAVLAGYLMTDAAFARSVVTRGGAPEGGYGVAFAAQAEPLAGLPCCSRR